MKFTIDRTVWLRGEGPGKSALLRTSDGKMCCIGIFLKACGIPDAALADCNTAVEITVPRKKSSYHVGGFYGSAHFRPLPEAYREFLRDDRHGSDINRLYIMNDDGWVEPDAREREITALFAKHGIEVEFVN